MRKKAGPAAQCARRVANRDPPSVPMGLGPPAGPPAGRPLPTRRPWISRDHFDAPHARAGSPLAADRKAQPPAACCLRSPSPNRPWVGQRPGLAATCDERLRIHDVRFASGSRGSAQPPTLCCVTIRPGAITMPHVCRNLAGDAQTRLTPTQRCSIPTNMLPNAALTSSSQNLLWWKPSHICAHSTPERGSQPRVG